MSIINKLSVAALVGGLSACGAAFAQETQTFDSAASAGAAGWTELNSRTAPQNFGFSNTANAGGPAGEAGGTFFRQPTSTQGAGAFYADTSIGLLDINQPMTFTTKWNSVDRNSEIYVGFFNTAFGSPANGGAAQLGVLPNFIGFRIDDTRVYVEAISARGNPIGSDPSDEGTDTIINEGGTPLAENTVHTLTFTFTPDAGGGVGMVTGQIDSQPPVSATSGRGDGEFSSGFNTFGLHTKGGGDNPQGPQNMFFDNITYTSAVPEPASLGLLGLGAVALMARRRSA